MLFDMFCEKDFKLFIYDHPDLKETYLLHFLSGLPYGFLNNDVLHI